MARRLALAALLTAACATPPPPQPKQAWPDAPPPGARAGASASATGAAEARPPPPPAVRAGAPSPARRDGGEDTAQLFDKDPRGWLARVPGADACEAAARGLRPSGPERAWKALRACVARGPFKSLNRLTDGFWDVELRAQADAPVMLASVLAARGADLANDLGVLQRRKVPLFTLETARAHPDLYKGRSVVFLAQVEDFATAKSGKVTARLAVVGMVAKGRVVAERSEYGSRGNYSMSTVSTGDWDESLRVRYDNQFEVTGEQVLGRLARLDPFFEPGKNFLLVGRFEGFQAQTATLDDPEPATEPVVTVHGYFEPGAQMAE